jgi:phosphoglycerol transferase MdoB-like AlkP superfamily enzyme
VLSRVLGALLRALLVVVVIATPSLLVPGTTEEGAQVVVLVALALAVFVGVEYGATYPALIEFRDAAPFNRIRILSLLVILVLTSLVARGAAGDTSLMLVLGALGRSVGQMLDFPVSPLAFILTQLPQEGARLGPVQVTEMAGLALLSALVSLAVFVVLLRGRRWPAPDQAFNVWVNLPTFDPTMGGDIVPRLMRDARVNFVLAIVALLILPAAGLRIVGRVDPLILTAPHALVWGIALWIYLPLSLAMRGLAMMRVASLIRERRSRLVVSLLSDAPQAV